MCCVQIIGVWGDIGHTPNSTDTRNHLLAQNPEIVYNTADFVYAGAQDECCESTWIYSAQLQPASLVCCVKPILRLLDFLCLIPCA